MGSNDYKYFRFPFLAEGETQEKRDGVREFLFHNGYKIAPVTLDFFDYDWGVSIFRTPKAAEYRRLLPSATPRAKPGIFFFSRAVFRSLSNSNFIGYDSITSPRPTKAFRTIGRFHG